MAEIALPTYSQVDAIANNQTNNMTHYVVDVVPTSNSVSTLSNMINITGSGVLMYVAKTLEDPSSIRFKMTIDFVETGFVQVGGEFDSIATFLIPFKERLIIDGYYIGAGSTQVDIFVMLK